MFCVGVKHTPLPVRRYTLRKLIQSVRRHISTAVPIVAYDGPGTFTYKNAISIQLPQDAGVSMGRNTIVNDCKHEVIIIVDDDVEFFKNSRLKDMVNPILQNRVDVVTGCYIERGLKKCYAHQLNVDDGVVSSRFLETPNQYTIEWTWDTIFWLRELHS